MMMVPAGPAVWPRNWNAVPSGATSFSSPTRMRANRRNNSCSERGCPAARMSPLTGWVTVFISLLLRDSIGIEAVLRHAVELRAAQPEFERLPVDRRHHLERHERQYQGHA